MSSGMEFLDSPMLMVQYGLALAVPAVLTAIMNLGCGKKRDQPLRPGEKKTLSKSAKPAGASSKSKRASKSSSASAKSGKSSKKDKSGKSKKSASKDKSGKSSKSSKKSSKKDKSSKSSKSKKSKRDLKSKNAAAIAAAGGGASQRSDAAKQPSSGAARGEADKRSAKLATQTAVALANDNSAKSAPTQVASASLKQPPSGGALDGNANVAVATGAGGTALVAIAGDSTRELKMEPAELRWSSAGGMQKISLINQSAERQAIKVKCSDNNVYRVNPVYAIVEPGQTLNVDVMRQNGSNKVDKIVFVTARAGIEENPKNAFKPGAPASMMVLPLLATSAAAAHNQPALAV